MVHCRVIFYKTVNKKRALGYHMDTTTKTSTDYTNFGLTCKYKVHQPKQSRYDSGQIGIYFTIPFTEISRVYTTFCVTRLYLLFVI